MADHDQIIKSYDDMSDDQVRDGIYNKFYSSMPRPEFDEKTKFITRDELLRRAATSQMQSGSQQRGNIEEFGLGLIDPAIGAAQLAEHMVPGVVRSKEPSLSGEPKVPQLQNEPITPARALGGMVSLGGLAGAAARAAPKIITSPMLRSIAAGAAGGVLQPVEGGDYWNEKKNQIGEGMALGYGFSVAGKAASSGLNALGGFLARKYPENATNQAVTEILKRIGQDNKYGAPSAQQMLDLVGAANDTGKPMVMVDVGGRNLRSLAGHVTRAPGESRQMAESFFLPRDEAAAKRLGGDISKYVSSGSSMYDTVEGFLRARSAASNPLYRETDQLQNIWSPRLQQFMDNPTVARGMARGYEIERLESLAENRPFDPTMMGVDLDQEGNIKILRTPNMRVLDMAKKGLDAMVADHRDAITGRLDMLGVALDKVRRAYVSELDSLDKNGVYKKARDAWGGVSASLDAVRFGRGVFSRSPEENAATLADMTSGNQEFARIGLADILRERLGKAGFGSDESRALIRNPWMRDQMRPFFKSGDDFNKFVDAVTNENVMAKTKNELLRGPQTAEREAEDNSADAATLASGARIGRGLVRAAVDPLHFFHVLAEMWRLHKDVTRRPDPQVNEAMAKILFAPDISKTPLGQRLLQGPLPPTGNPMAGIADKTWNVAAPALGAASTAQLPRSDQQ